MKFVSTLMLGFMVSNDFAHGSNFICVGPDLFTSSGAGPVKFDTPAACQAAADASK